MRYLSLPFIVTTLIMITVLNENTLASPNRKTSKCISQSLRIQYYDIVGLGNTDFKNNITARFSGPPIVETSSTITSITQNSAIIEGNVITDGGTALNARGICWSSETQNPSIYDNLTTNGINTGTFTSQIVELSPGTRYYARAYATNSYGTSYGNVITFITEHSTEAQWLESGHNMYFTEGNVGIGTDNSFSDAKLTVNGKILAKEIKIVSNITSDYVFYPGYKLMPLNELESYLKQHKHLPGIPSADEFAKSGQNLGEMDDLLLRKIEELTLYLLNQENEFNTLDNTIEKLEREIQILKEQGN